MKKKLAFSDFSGALPLHGIECLRRASQQRSVILHIRKPRWGQHPRQNAYHRNYDRDNYSVSALYGCL